VAWISPPSSPVPPRGMGMDRILFGNRQALIFFSLSPGTDGRGRSLLPSSVAATRVQRVPDGSGACELLVDGRVLLQKIHFTSLNFHESLIFVPKL